jgi:hypothetical protein
MSSFKAKLAISISSALMFLVINLPQTYKLTDKFFPGNLLNNGCPTALGLLIHTLVFFGISFLTMGTSDKLDTGVKIKHSLYGSLIFFFLSSPVMYKIVGKLINGVSNTLGCPTLFGIILHTIVYCASLVAVMYLPD